MVFPYLVWDKVGFYKSEIAVSTGISQEWLVLFAFNVKLYCQALYCQQHFLNG